MYAAKLVVQQLYVWYCDAVAVSEVYRTTPILGRRYQEGSLSKITLIQISL